MLRLYQNVAQEHSTSDFYLFWSSQNSSRHNTTLTMYQNTINYNTPPRFDPQLPTITVLQNVTNGPVLDLRAYAEEIRASLGS